MVAGLVTLARFPIHQANGTSLATLMVPVGILGVMEYHRRGQVNIPAAATLAVGVLIGAWIGARWAQQVSGPVLQRAFAVFLVVMAVRMWIRAGA